MLQKILLLLILAALAGCNGKEEAVRPSAMPLTEAVYASGAVQAQNQYAVAAQTDGYLSGKMVEPGDTVKSGQTLFVINSEADDIRLRNARQVLEQAEANTGANSPVVRELENSVATARAKMVQDSINYMRYKALLNEEAVSRSAYEGMELAYRTSRNNYQSLLQKLQSTRNQLRLERSNARSQYELVLQSKGDHVLKSLVDGIVLSVNKESGELVRRQEMVAMIGDAGKPLLKLNVDEQDISKIEIGQKVLVKTDVFEDEVLEARITKMHPLLNAADQTFTVEAEFVKDIPLRFTGMTVEANIIISQKENTIAIPRSYVQGKDSVWVERDGEEQKVRIQKGIENMEWVEVLSGLDTNTVLLKK